MKRHCIATIAALLGLAGLGAVQGQTYYRTAPTTYYYPYYGGYYQEAPEPGVWYYDFYRPRPTTTTTSRAWTRNAQAKAQQLSGEVIRTRKVDVQGTDEQVWVALVNTPDDKRVIVDLGSADELKSEGIRLRKGEEIQARGWYSKVGHHRVFIANRVTANDQTAAITRKPSKERLEKEARVVGSEESEETGKTARGNTERTRGERGEFQNIQGKITQVKQFSLPGMSRKWSGALVQTRDGEKYLVNLGPQNKLGDLELEKGMQISVRGPVCWVGGEHMMLAQRIRANGQTVESNEEGEMTRPESRQISGEVESTRFVQLPGTNHKWLMAQLKDKDGKEFFVNFGPEDDVEKLELTRGEQVSLTGDCVEFHGRQFCLARRVRANGQTIRVNDQQD